MNRPFLGKTFASFCRLRFIRLYASKLVSGQMNDIFLWNCVADSAVGNKQVCAGRKDLVMNTSHIGQSLAFSVWRFDFGTSRRLFSWNQNQSMALGLDDNADRRKVIRVAWCFILRIVLLWSIEFRWATNKVRFSMRSQSPHDFTSGFKQTVRFWTNKATPAVLAWPGSTAYASSPSTFIYIFIRLCAETNGKREREQRQKERARQARRVILIAASIPGHTFDLAN